MGDETFPESGGKRMRGRPNVVGGCVKRDLERVGGEWRTTAKDKMRWSLLIENKEREKIAKTRRRNEQSNHGQPHP